MNNTISQTEILLQHAMNEVGHFLHQFKEMKLTMIALLPMVWDYFSLSGEQMSDKNQQF